MKWVLRSCVVLTVLGICWGLTQWYFETQWKSAQTRMKQTMAKLEQLPRTRPVLWGKETAGESFPHYLAAIQMVDDPQLAADLAAAELAVTAPTPLGVPGAAASSAKGEAPEVPAPQTVASGLALRERLRQATAPVLKQLRIGAHASLGGRAASSVGDIADMPRFLALKQIRSALVLHAIERIESGEAIEGVRILLDGVQCGRDLYHDPILTLAVASDLVRIGPTVSVFGALAFDRGGPPSGMRKLTGLPAEALKLLHEGLAQAAAYGPPVSVRAEMEGVVMFQTISQMGPEAWDIGGGGLWSWLISTRGLVADSCLASLNLAGRLPAPEVPWLKARAEIDAIVSEARGKFNPVVRMAAVNWSSLEVSVRRTRARFRLLRLAVADAASLPLELRDPFTGGAKLRRREAAGRTVYWSVGQDGVDNGGDGEKDVVLIQFR